MKPIVLDCSIAMTWCFEDEISKSARFDKTGLLAMAGDRPVEDQKIIRAYIK